MSDPLEIANTHLQQGFACSQSVLCAYAERYGVPLERARAIAAPFGGGIGRTGQVCGAVSGALMVIGLHYWDDAADVRQVKERIYLYSQEFMQRFISLNGTMSCRELTGVDMLDPTALQKARDELLFDRICPGFVRDSVMLLENFLAEQSKNEG
jgi:C_GCAxxG_C_C family probable redox protein